MNVRETAQLVRFFASLAVKEHIKPDLHVRPLVAELFLTENCNLRCISCACWREVTRNELTTDEWKDVLSQIARLGIFKANFTGGEALLRKDAVELLRYANSIGISRLHLNTNAILLTPAKLDEILDAGVRSFNISVDGPRDLHDEIRGRKGAFDITVAHLREVVRRRKQYGLKIRMMFTVMRRSAAALPEIARLAQRLRVQLYLNLVTDQEFLFRGQEITEQTHVDQDQLARALQELESIARHDHSWLPRYSDLSYVPRYFQDMIQAGLPCAESQLKLMIHSRGEVGGCWVHEPEFNVRDMPIREIVDGPRYRDEHSRFFRKECLGCGSNYSLNLRWRPETYAHDLLWRLGRRRIVPDRTPITTCQQPTRSLPADSFIPLIPVER